MGNQVVAGFARAFIPVTLDWMGLDPSVASSVFLHTLTDLCGFFLLLGLASQLLLGGVIQAFADRSGNAP